MIEIQKLFNSIPWIRFLRATKTKCTNLLEMLIAQTLRSVVRWMEEKQLRKDIIGCQKGKWKKHWISQITKTVGVSKYNYYSIIIRIFQYYRSSNGFKKQTVINAKNGER